MSSMTKLLLFLIAMAANQVVIRLVAHITGDTKEVVASSFALGMVVWVMIDSAFSKGDTK